MYTSKPKRGFVALISILILSVVLLTAVLSLSYKGLTSRFLLLDLEYKSETEKWAEGCISSGIIAVVNDPLYEVSDRYVEVGSGACSLTIVSGSGDRTLQATATSTSGATTNLEVEVNPFAQTLEDMILTWRELPSF